MSDHSTPLVTIGIPTYNRADFYLKQALESALSQDYPNFEIIVSDNCSTDGTKDFVAKYFDPRIRYFRQPTNIPANDNFNFCLQKAAGAYFLLLHDDDMIDCDFLSTCMEAADYSTDFGIIRTGVRIIDSEANILVEKENLAQGLTTKDFFLTFLSRKLSMLLCATLFNTKKLTDSGGFNSKHQLWQDVCAEFTVAAKFGRLDVKDIKASFRTHPSQRTVNVNIANWCEDSMYLLDLMCDLLPSARKLIRNKGLPYFARHNYSVASRLQSPIKKFIAYLVVYRSFNYRFAPPPLRSWLSKVPFYSYLRSLIS